MGIKVEIQGKSGHKVVELNRRRAIRERCLNCGAWSFAEANECRMVDCQLYPFRSGKGRQDAKARAKAIRDYCSWCMSTERAGRCVIMDCPLFCYRKSTLERPKKPLYDGVEGRVAVNA